MNKISPYLLKDYNPPNIEAHIRHGSELFNSLLEDYLSDPKKVQGFPTKYWPTFNKAFGGTRPGEIVTITGETGSGKSTFALNWLLDHLEQNRSGLLISLENGWKMSARKLAQLIVGKEFGSFDDCDFKIIDQTLKQLPLWVLDWSGPIRQDLLLKAIEYAAREKRVSFIILDHLDYVERSNKYETEASSIGILMRNLSGLANSLDLTISLIAHPAKLDTKGKPRKVGIDDLKGSSSIKQESSAVFSIYQPDPTKAVTQLHFLKIRADSFSRSIRGKLRFQFNRESLRLLELSTEVEWDDL